MDSTRKITIDKNHYDETHVGDFVLRLPTIQEEIDIGKREKDLIGRFHLTDLAPTTQNIVIAVAALEVVVKDAPPWWWIKNEDGKKVPRNLLEMTDQSIITMLYAEYYKWRFLPDERGGGKEGSGEPGESASVEAGENAGNDDPESEKGD